MRIIDATGQLNPDGRRICVAIGVFDGVHLGHQQVIRQSLADAKELGGLGAVITFDRHPSATVAPDRVPPLIYSLPQKLRAIAALGTDVTWLVRFDEAFSRQTGEEFVRGLARDFGRLHSVSVGADFTFGHKRSGDVALMTRLGGELGFAVRGLPAVVSGGMPVSSTHIREAILAGQLQAASQLLGRPYSLAGQVVSGDRLGHRLGFPTANLETAGLALPPNGVYAVQARLRDESYRAVLNIGVRPTLDGAAPGVRVEAHLLDFNRDLYGEEMEITFVQKLREERRFPSLEALKEQIACDIREGLACLAQRLEKP